MANFCKIIAQRWNDVRHAVVNKQQCPAAFERMYIGTLTCGKEGGAKHLRKSKKVPDRRIRAYFLLSKPLQGIALTKREVQVLYLICNGCTNKVVAECMGLSERTTEYYVKNIRTKTKTNSKLELVRHVIQTDFLQRVDNSDLFLDPV